MARAHSVAMPGGAAIASVGSTHRSVVGSKRKNAVFVKRLDVSAEVEEEEEDDRQPTLEDDDDALTRAILADDTKSLRRLLERRAHVDHPMSNMTLAGAGRCSGITPLQLACHKSAW